MIWSRLALVFSLFPARRTPDAEAQKAAIDEANRRAAEAARRWWKARNADPELMADVIRMGGLLTAQPFENAEVADLDPHRLAYEAGRRDLALQLTALMGLSLSELNSLMGDDDA